MQIEVFKALGGAPPAFAHHSLLIGADVLTDSGERLGTVTRLLETGANDVLVVKACAGSVDTRERLIPYLPGDTIIRVDLEAAVIEVDWFLDED